MDNLELFLNTEEAKMTYILGINKNKVYAVSCPTFGDTYKAYLIIKDENGNKYRYDLATGKQFLIADEYSTIQPPFLRTLEKILAGTYVLNNIEGVNTFWDALVASIDRLNQNTAGWVNIFKTDKYSNIPKFSNRRKPTAKKTDASK